jgi:hypothetical protein
MVRLGSTASIGSQHLPHYSYVILGKDEVGYAARIRRQSPRSIVLAYETAPELVDNCVPVSSVCPGITYQEALAHDARHPRDQWILRTASGRSLVNPHYPYEHLANVGSTSFQRQWANRVADAALKRHFNGVMIDDVLGLISVWTGGPMPAALPSDRAWENAMRDFMRYVGPALKRRGLFVGANAFKGGSNDGSADVQWWSSIARSVDGLMAEYWEQSSVDLRLFDMNPCCWTGHWDGWLKLADAAQNAGAAFFPLQYGRPGDTRTMRYGKASFLLVWNGSTGGYVFLTREATDPWNPAWTTRVGKPLGRRRRIGVGWRRDFTRATVLVNPNPGIAQTFRLGPKTSVTVPPVDAAILPASRPKKR